MSVSEGNILTIFGPDDGDGEGKNGVGGDGDTNKSGDGREKGVVVEGKAGKDGRKVINLKMKVLCTVTLQGMFYFIFIIFIKTGQLMFF